MKRVYHISNIIKAVAILLTFMGSSYNIKAQSCKQIEIIYQEPDCYKAPKDAVSPAGNQRACKPITVCERQQYTYTASAGAWSSYNWVILSGPSIPSITPSNTSPSVNITWPAVGVYVLELTVSDGTNTYTTCLEVTVKIKPTANFTFTLNNACTGSTTYFTNTSTPLFSSVYSWDFGEPSSGASNYSNLQDPSHIYTTTGPHVVTLIAYSSVVVVLPPGTSGQPGDTISIKTCCADTIKKTVTVNPGSIHIDCISTVCAGSTHTYTMTGCASPTWSAPIGAASYTTSGNQITITWGNGNVQGQIIGSCPGGCTAAVTVPIVPSTPVISGITNPCKTATSSYTVPFLPGTFYTWTLTDLTTNTNVSYLINTYPDNNTAVINWNSTTPGHAFQLQIDLDNKEICCKSRGTLTITPLLKFVINAPPTICPNTPMVANISPIAFTPPTFTWATVTPGVSGIDFTVTGSPSGYNSATYSFITGNTYTIVANENTGAYCNNTASATVIVPSMPVPATPSGPTTICLNTPYTYTMSTAAPLGYYYQWTITNGVFMPGSLPGPITGNSVNAQFTSIGGAGLTVQLVLATFPSCLKNAGSVGPFTLSPPGSLPPISPNVCVDNSDSYTVTGIPPGTVVTWTIIPPGLGTITSPPGANPCTIKWHGGTGTGPWTATVQATTPCNASPISTTVFIKPKFIFSLTETNNICTVPNGSTITITGLPPGTYTYTWPPPIVGAGATGTVNVAGTYTITVSNGACSYSRPITIKNPLQIIAHQQCKPYCVGNAVHDDLSVTVITPGVGPFTYQWYTGLTPAPGNAIPAATSPFYTALTYGPYSVVVGYGLCRDTASLIVEKICCPPIATISPITIVRTGCNSFTFTATAVNPGGYPMNWGINGGSFPASSGVPFSYTFPPGTPAGDYCVYYHVGPPSPNPTSCTGNYSTNSVRIPIKPYFEYKIGCNGCLQINNLSELVPITNAYTVNYAWDFGDGSMVVNSALPAAPAHCYTTPGPHTLQLVMSYSDVVSGTPISCSYPYSVIVPYTPISINVPTPVCSNQSALFSSNVSGNILSYNWAFGDGFFGFSPSDTHTYATTGAFNIIFTVQDDLGNTCTKNTPVNVLQGITNCTITPGYICPGSTATLNAPTGTGYTHQWQVLVGGNMVNAPGASTGATYTTNVAGFYNVIITASNGCSCTSNTVEVKNVPKPTVKFTVSPSQNMCGGGVIGLTALNFPGYNYAWSAYGSGAGFGGNSFISSYYIPPSSPTSTITNIHLVVTNEYGCKDSCIMPVVSQPLPVPPFISASSVCEGVPITLTVTNYPANITWNNGSTGSVITVHSAGTYVATYTNPVTGCTSSSSITINRRPSAGLFPHFCDSIPCNCTRPFVIYAPNPLIGTFASLYTINWYNAATNAYLGTGNSYNNGGLGAQTGGYYIIITDQTTNCKDTSNVYSIVVPKCDTCDCKGSKWGEISLTKGEGNPTIIKCGGSYVLDCNKPYTINASFICKDTTCKGKVTYSLQQPIGSPLTGNVPLNFIPNQNGLYILTLYGWCGSKKCDSCVIKFDVKCDPCNCTGSHWGDIVMKQDNGGINPDIKANVNVPVQQILKCGGTYKLDCNKSFTINANFFCKDSACNGKVTYSLQQPTGLPLTGTAPLTFTPTQTGTYILTLYGWCGNKICDSCVIKFDVKCDPCNCTGSHWGEIVLTQDNGPVNPDVKGNINIPVQQFLKCGGSYKIDCNKPTTINAAFICQDPKCPGKTTYSLQPPTGLPLTGTSPLTFTPTQNGTYVLTLYGWCGGKICDSCVIKFDVQCETVCDCVGSHWGETTITSNNTTKPLVCNKSYDWKCRQTFTINAAYNCAKPNCSGAVSYLLTPPVGLPLSGAVPLTYTPTQPGGYTLVLYGWCGNKKCDSCIIKFKVGPCEVDTVCCKYDIKIQQGSVTYAPSPSGNATIASQTFTISGLATASITEVRAEVMSYDISSNYNNECLGCKTFPFTWASINSANNIGAVIPKITLFGGTTPLFNPTGAAMYQNPREVIWNNGSTFSIGAPIGINFILPPQPVIDCCELKGKICVKFTFRDDQCRECEVIACFEVVIKKK